MTGLQNDWRMRSRNRVALGVQADPDARIKKQMAPFVSFLFCFLSLFCAEPGICMKGNHRAGTLKFFRVEAEVWNGTLSTLFGD